MAPTPSNNAANRSSSCRSAATTTAKVMAACFILSICMQSACVDASAIPIWEFLTANEKISYLYSTFAQLVSMYCKATTASSAVPVNQCKRNLLAYGYEKLQTFTDAQLDTLDPYQRGADELIWASIMRDHANSMLITTRKPLPTPPASSIIILTQQKPVQEASVPLPASASSTSTSSGTTQQYPKNPLFETDAEHKHKYAMDMDIAYGYPGASRQPNPQVETFEGSQPHTQQQLQKTYLTGPLVFRVRPDGTPVEEDQYRPLPRDDDLEAFPHSSTTASGSSGKHRKIATISALKQQHLATLALQQQLQPPYEQPRTRRQFQLVSNPVRLSTRAATGYHYGKGLA